MIDNPSTDTTCLVVQVETVVKFLSYASELELGLGNAVELSQLLISYQFFISFIFITEN